MTVHVNVPVDDAIKADLEALAQTRGLAVDEMLVEAVTAYVDDQRALQAAIAEGIASLDAGEGIPHEEVVAWLAERRNEWSKAE